MLSNDAIAVPTIRSCFTIPVHYFCLLIKLFVYFRKVACKTMRTKDHLSFEVRLCGVQVDYSVM